MLSSKQRAYLRGLANDAAVLLSVGKGGVSPNVVAQAEETLEARELIKGAVQRNSEVSAREACALLAEATGAEPVQVIGNRFVLYRPSREKKIKLPG